MGGYGVSLLGHSNEKIVQAISDQAKQLTSCHGSFYNEQRARASININKITPKHLDNIYLCNSGAEAVDAALNRC